MIVLGINFGHDSATAIIKDGVLVAAMEEEKISRVKQDIGWPENALNKLMSDHNIKPEEVSVIALEDIFPTQLGKFEILYRFGKRKHYKYREYLSRIAQYIFRFQRINPKRNKALIEAAIRKKGFVNAKIQYVDHHLSHAASAFYTSPIRCNLIITADGRGGEDAFNFYQVDANGLKIIRKNSYSVSLGAFYSTITQLLGFRPNRHEGKITGLAAYGEETELTDNFRNLFLYQGKELTRYPFGDINFLWKKERMNAKLSQRDKINLETSSSQTSEDFGRRNLLLLEHIRNLTDGYSKEDIAYACQVVTEEVILKELDLVLQECRIQEPLVLGLAGGVFANVRINQKLYEHPSVENIFIHPAMGDSGLAVGNAILADLKEAGRQPDVNRYQISTTFLGADYSSELKEFVQEFTDDTITMHKMEHPDLEVSDLLKQNKIVGLWTGKMEWGPRALGRRSIILNTFDRDVNKVLNDRLNRTEFMPFAPVVLDYMAKTYFPDYDPKVPAADYMTITYDTKPAYRELLQATVHVDGTARPQIAYRDKSPLYYDILDKFYKATDCAALVNTSFNAHEEPILSSPETAIQALKSNRVDYLVMDTYLFYIKDNEHLSEK
jgi:carbamoyltransferase